MFVHAASCAQACAHAVKCAMRTFAPALDRACVKENAGVGGGGANEVGGGGGGDV